MCSSNQHLSRDREHVTVTADSWLLTATTSTHLEVIQTLLGDVVGVAPKLLHGGEFLPEECGSLGHLRQLLAPGDDVDDVLLLLVHLVHDLHVLLNDLLSLGHGAGEDIPGGLSKLLGGELHQGHEIIRVLQ